MNLEVKTNCLSTSSFDISRLSRAGSFFLKQRLGKNEETNFQLSTFNFQLFTFYFSKHILLLAG